MPAHIQHPFVSIAVRVATTSSSSSSPPETSSRAAAAATCPVTESPSPLAPLDSSSGATFLAEVSRLVQMLEAMRNVCTEQQKHLEDFVSENDKLKVRSVESYISQSRRSRVRVPVEVSFCYI